MLNIQYQLSNLLNIMHIHECYFFLVGGHDCSEDATACMELMLWKVKEDTKGRRY